MAFTFDIPEEIGGVSAYLEAPGQYHAIVLMVHNEAIPKSDGGFIPVPGGFGVELEVAHGDHENKKFSLTFWGQDPQKDPKDSKNLWAASNQYAFFLATDCVSASASGGKEIDLQDAVGSQVFIDIDIEEYVGRNGKTYTRPKLVRSNVYHVDDPMAKSFKRNESLIATIPKENRHSEDYFAPIMAKRQSKKSGVKPVPKSRMSANDLADL